MTLHRFKLGELIEQCSGGNELGQFGPSDVRGISVNKEFIPTKANLAGVSLKGYTVVEPRCFSFVTVTSRNGGRISIAFNNTKGSFIVSSFYVTFRLSEAGKARLLEEYLFMYFKRAEFDRYARRDSWGSAREYFYYENMCDVEIDLPPIEVQRKYVEIYASILENQQCYDRGLADLKLACDAYIDSMIRSLPRQRIGDYLLLSDKRNGGDYAEDAVRGISTEKKFIPTKANLKNVDLNGYKKVLPGDIAYVADTSRRGEKISIALNDTAETFIVSSISIVFSTRPELNQTYLMLFFSRSEFDRYARYNSWGSARESFNWEDMQNVEIPMPDYSIQSSIANVYLAYIERTRINEQLKTRLDNLCSILIKGSIDEARR